MEYKPNQRLSKNDIRALLERALLNHHQGGIPADDNEPYFPIMEIRQIYAMETVVFHGPNGILQLSYFLPT